MSKILDETFGIEAATISTTHPYTADQMVLDGRHADLRRARSAACNIAPTSTRAVKAIGEILPGLKGKVEGMSYRVPVPQVSCADLVIQTKRNTTKEAVNQALQKAA